MDFYKTGLRPLLFSGLNVDPEWLHQQTIRALAWLARPQRYPLTAKTTDLTAPYQRWLSQPWCYPDAKLNQRLWSLSFPNPLGLAAGFDKNGDGARAWPLFGFGFAELGTVTWQAQSGNSRPRLFRLPSDRAVLNRMGFNNRGAGALKTQLETLQLTGDRPVPLGINLGKSKVTPLDQAADDYLLSFRLLKALGDYFVVNVSSPNTPGLRSLQAKDQLEKILAVLQRDNQGEKPLLVKIAPDLTEAAIAEILSLAQTYQLAGIIATNTTISRQHLKTQTIQRTGNHVQDEAGGISGEPLRQRSTEVIRFIWQQTQGQLPIVGVGGIFTADDAWAKITAGASLLQTYTGWVYEGPAMVRRILMGLSDRLADHQLDHLSQAVGLDHRAADPLKGQPAQQ
ncbi:MAG: quinone-dependent dihydroorotate dehydrogenase [Cyanobacteria bacterium P01_C01_bin.73]